MKRLLLTLLVLISLGLCAVCVVQWQREARLRGHITDLVKRLEAENAARVEAERKAREYEKEIERLTELRAEYGEAAELWLLIGGDSLAALPGWRHWQQIFTLANLAVWQRPDLPTPPLPPELAARWQARQVADFSKRTQYGTIRALTLPAQAVSATAIRQALAAGQPCAGLLAPAVVDYINQQHLYGR